MIYKTGVIVYTIIMSSMMFFTAGCDSGSPPNGVPGPDTGPLVTEISPPADSVDVITSRVIVVKFDQSLDGSTMGIVLLVNPAATSFVHGVNCTMSFSQTDKANDTVTISHSGVLSTETSYSEIVVKDFKDDSGELVEPYRDVDYNFMTEGPPEITAITPASGSENVSRETNIQVRFNRSMDSATFGTVTMTYTATEGNGVLTFTNGSGCSMSFITSSVLNDTLLINSIVPDLNSNTTYSNIIVNGFADSRSNVMDEYVNAAYFFITGSFL